MRTVLLLVALVALAASASADDGTVRVLEDPEGDAADGDARKAESLVCPGCRGVVGGEASPAFDVVAVDVTPGEDAWEVALVVAGLGDLADVVPPPGRFGYVTWSVCWNTRGDWSDECAQLVASRGEPGTLEVLARYSTYDDCNLIHWCGWNVPVRHEPGAPGRIVFTVPSGLLHAARPDGAARDFIAGVYKGDYEPTSRRVETDTPLGYRQLATPRPGGSWVVDFAGDSSARVPLPSTAPVPSPVDHVDVEEGAQSEDLDVRTVRISDDGTALRIALEMARVDATPEPHAHWLGLGTPDGRLLYAGYSVLDGVRQPWAGYCPENDCTRFRAAPHTFEAVPGTPGRLLWTFQLDDLNATEGDLLKLAVFEMFRREDGRPEPAQVFPGRVTRLSAYDFVGPTPAYVIGSRLEDLGIAAPVERRGMRVEDPLGDATPPAPVPGASASVGASYAQYDVTGVAAEGLTPTESRLTLEVRDLTKITVERGHAALIYAVAVETDGGAFLAGYYRAADGAPLAGQKGRQEFFCSADTVVFASPGTDPMDGVVTTIRGVIGVAGQAETSDQATGGGSGQGAITFFVPHECLGRSTSGPVEVKRLHGGVYAVDLQGNVLAADTAGTDEPGTLEALVVASDAAPVPFYARPFGIEGFWDIFGIVAAVLTSAGGVLLVARRRGMLRRYLDEVERADEAGLVAIRARLKRDLVRGAIAEGHYVLVERRLDERLARSRIEGLREAFHELPHRLLERLQGMLADGRMSAEDHRVFMALLVDAPLTEEAKEKVRRKLDAWVAKDA